MVSPIQHPLTFNQTFAGLVSGILIIPYFFIGKFSPFDFAIFIKYGNKGFVLISCFAEFARLPIVPATFLADHCFDLIFFFAVEYQPGEFPASLSTDSRRLYWRVVIIIQADKISLNRFL